MVVQIRSESGESAYSFKLKKYSFTSDSLSMSNLYDFDKISILNLNKNVDKIISAHLNVIQDIFIVILVLAGA